MNLFLCRVRHPQARDNYRVIVKLDGAEIEVGSIGIQTTNTGSMWVWGLDCVVPMGGVESEGTAKVYAPLRAAWDRFAADKANLTAFLKMKRAARG